MNTPRRKSWMERLAYNLGKTIHDVKNDVKSASSQDGVKTSKQTIRHDVDETKLDSTTTLRRTVIEEIEVKQPSDPRDPREDAKTQ